MTGQFPVRRSIHQHFAGITANRNRGMADLLDPQGPSLPRILQEAGCQIGHFGKWHLGGGPGVLTEDQYGYDAFATFNVSKMHEIKTDGLASVDHMVSFIRESKEKFFYVNLLLHEVHLAHYPLQKHLEQFKGLDGQPNASAVWLTYRTGVYVFGRN